MNIKPYYNSELVSIYWDIPEYYGNDNEDVENNLSRPDAKIYFKNEKKIVVIEMSVPWIENRESKLTEKIDKQELMNQWTPGYCCNFLPKIIKEQHILEQDEGGLSQIIYLTPLWVIFIQSVTFEPL